MSALIRLLSSVVTMGWCVGAGASLSSPIGTTGDFWVCFPLCSVFLTFFLFSTYFYPSVVCYGEFSSPVNDDYCYVFFS